MQAPLQRFVIGLTLCQPLARNAVEQAADADLLGTGGVLQTLLDVGGGRDRRPLANRYKVPMLDGGGESSGQGLDSVVAGFPSLTYQRGARHDL